MSSGIIALCVHLWRRFPLLFLARLAPRAAMDGRFDELLLGLVQKHEGIDALWYTLMSFYERRTDLFHVKETVDDKKGFKPGEAEDMFRRQFAHFQARYLERAQPHLLAHNRQALESRLYP